MLFKSLLVALLAPMLVLAKIVINSAHYNGNGTVTLSVTEYTDAPATFGLYLVNTNGTKTTIVGTVAPESGVYYVTLPTVPAGSYKILAEDSTGTVLSTSPSFTVGATDFSSTVTAGGYSATSTGTEVPFVTKTTVSVNGTATVETFTVYASTSVSVSLSTASPSPTTSLFTTETVFTSGTVTTTIISTGSMVETLTPTPSPVTVTPATATATTTTSKSGAERLGMGALPVLAAIAAGALML